MSLLGALLPWMSLKALQAICSFLHIQNDIKSSEVKVFWNRSSTVMGALNKASVTNSKNIIRQVLSLQTDFSEALSNTTRGTIQPGNTSNSSFIHSVSYILIFFLDAKY